ncbi:hypothetical protein BD626DRAFT_150650 [Schizophyllum amplum]|uniref:Uncharacterized protein n=1 Tax=Schizophyllum amplum TaxID=97359 RepID=A0A550C458_9AGAR|nr:hypothetical protein BD626DRAFT_150650 [Auriculariopsis ampla]
MPEDERGASGDEDEQAVPDASSPREDESFVPWVEAQEHRQRRCAAGGRLAAQKSADCTRDTWVRTNAPLRKRQRTTDPMEYHSSVSLPIGSRAAMRRLFPTSRAP